MKKIKAIKIIRKELKESKTNWCLVEALSRCFNLLDTAYRDKIRNKQKEALLSDYLLSISYWKKKTN